MPLRTPTKHSQSVGTAAERIPFATPVSIENALRLLGLPEAVWADVDEGDLGQRKAEIIASIAGVDDVAWEEREERMIHLAEKCIERDWSEDDVRDRVSAVKEDLQATQERKAMNTRDKARSAKEERTRLENAVRDAVEPLDANLGDLPGDVASSAKGALQRLRSEIEDHQERVRDEDKINEEIQAVDERIRKLQQGADDVIKGGQDVPMVPGHPNAHVCAYCYSTQKKTTIEDYIEHLNRQAEALQEEREADYDQLRSLKRKSKDLKRRIAAYQGAIDDALEAADKYGTGGDDALEDRLTSLRDDRKTLDDLELE